MSEQEIHALARDLGKVPDKLVSKITKIMPNTGLAMKQRMIKDLQGSSSFRPAARSVDYDVKTLGFGGDTVIQVEVGPNVARAAAGALENIAYFGTSMGGGTVPDPVVPMRLEAPVFFGFMEMATDGLL